jgi:hypothetical protein
MASLSHVDRLPEEVLLQIFEYLDSLPPSKIKAREEPSLSLTASDSRVLKCISCTSSRWRRVVIPLLFKYAHLRLDTPSHSTKTSCPACGQLDAISAGDLEASSSLLPIDSYHAVMVDAQERKLFPGTTIGIDATGQRYDLAIMAGTVDWSRQLYHVSKEFINFVTEYRLEQSIDSIVVSCSQTFAVATFRFWDEPFMSDWRYISAAAFWKHLLSIMDPSRVVLLMAPAQLSLMTNIIPDRRPALHDFDDVDFHLMELVQSEKRKAQRTSKPLDLNRLRPFAPIPDRFAPASILNLRNWYHLGLNEGSFLHHYPREGELERSRRVTHPHHGFLSSLLDRSIPSSSAVRDFRSFAYTAVFPFALHSRFSNALQEGLESLDVQLAVNPTSNAEDMYLKAYTGHFKGCWEEFARAYTYTAWHVVQAPNLKTLICRDREFPAIADHVDGLLINLCLPHWVEWKPGFYSRQHVDDNASGRQ